MSTVQMAYSQLIDAAPEAVYAVISDYHVGHPAILPKLYFTGLKILEGGQGAGTVIQVDMKIFGLERSFRQEISEPEPGRILQENSVELQRNLTTITSFIIEPRNDGQQSWVTIQSDFETAPGFQGFMERLMNPSILRRIYKAELNQLADYLRSQEA